MLITGALIIFRSRTLPKKYENAGLRVNSKVKARPAAPKESDVESALGGLDDEDAEAERPSMYPVKRAATAKLEFPDNLKRDKRRRNEVSIQGDSSHRMHLLIFPDSSWVLLPLILIRPMKTTP